MTELNNEYPIMDKMDKMEAGKSAYPRLFNNNYTIMADYRKCKKIWLIE